MKILHVLNAATTTSGPVERMKFLSELSDHQVYLVANNSHAVPSITSFPAAPSSRPVAQFRAIRSAIRAVAPDIVHSHHNMAGFLCRIQRNFDDSFRLVHSFGTPLAALDHSARTLHRASMWRNDAVIAVSPEAYDEVSKFFKKTILVRNGMSLERRNPEPQVRSAPEGGPSFCCIGRANPVKNIETLVRAFHSYVKEGGTGRLSLVGDLGPELGELIADLEATSSVKGRLLCLGRLSREEVRDELLHADFYVQPSFHEGTCVSVLEALSVGLPLILSDIASFREMRELGFFEAEYFDPSSNSMLVRALLDSEQRLFDKASLLLSNRRYLSQHFSPEVVAKGYEEAYALALSQDG